MPHQFVLVSISMPQCLFSMTCKYSTINIILTILISQKSIYKVPQPLFATTKKQPTNKLTSQYCQEIYQECL